MTLHLYDPRSCLKKIDVYRLRAGQTWTVVLVSAAITLLPLSIDPATHYYHDGEGGL